MERAPFSRVILVAVIALVMVLTASIFPMGLGGPTVPRSHLSSLASGPPVSGSHPAGAASLPRAVHREARPPAIGSVRPAAANIGRLAETYDFLNNTLLAGNFTNISNILAPQAGAVDPITGKIFVGGFSGLVGVVDAKNSTVVGSAPTYGGTGALAVDASGSKVYVADLLDSYVTVIDTKTLTVVGSVQVGQFLNAILYDAQNNEVYVAVGGAHQVAVLDGSSYALLRTIPTGNDPSSLALDPTHHRLYISNQGSANLTVVNASNDQVVGADPAGPSPMSISFSPQSGQVFVADNNATNLAVVNTTTGTIVANVSLAFYPTAVTVDPAIGFVYVTGGFISPVVEIVNVRTDGIIGSLPAISFPTALVYDSVTGDMYVAEYNTDNLTVINPGSNGVIGSIRLGFEPYAVAYDLKTGSIGVVMLDAGSFVIINGTTGAPIATFAVGLEPTAVAYDSVNECFYVGGTGSNTVVVINGTTLRQVSVISISAPVALSFVAAYDYMYVLSGSTRPIVGSQATIVSVVNGASNQVVGRIHVTGLNGIGGLAYDPVNGDLYVGVGNTITVVGALNQTFVQNISINGTSYAIAVDPATGTVYVGCLYGPIGLSFDANLTVINSTTNTISATLAMSDPVAALDYNAKNGLLYVGEQGGYGRLVALDPKNNTVVGTVADFLYPSALTDTGPTGQVIAADASSASLAIVSLPGLGEYAVNFSETGLAAGQSWTLVVNGGSYTSATSSLVVVEFDGPVSYTVTPVLGYTAMPNASSVTVDGSIVAVAIVFTPLPPTYGVNFAESGLPSGTNWSVTLAGVLENSTQPTITFHVANGTPQFSVTTISGFTCTPTTGTVHVAGKDVLINVTFTPVTSGTSTPGGNAPAGLGGLFGYGAAAAGAAVGGAIGAAVALIRRGRVEGPAAAVPVPPPES